MRNRFATLLSFIFMIFGVISILWVGSSLSGRAFSQTRQAQPVGQATQQPQEIPPPSMNLPPQAQPVAPTPTPAPAPPPPVQPPPGLPPQAQPVPPGGNLPPPDMGVPPDMGDESQMGIDPNSPQAQPSPSITEGQPILPGFNPEGYTYDPSGRRDPFMPFGANSVLAQPLPGPSVPAALAPPNENSLAFFELAQLKVVAIVWDVKDPKAMIMDPKGKLHMVHKDSPIGRNNGFVYAIREGEIVVIEPALNEQGAQTAVSRVMYLSGK